MELQKRHYYQIAAGIIVLVLIGWLIVKNRQPNGANSQQNLPLNANQARQIQPAESAGQMGSSLIGTLKLSDNPKKGNLMLIAAGRTTYIFTSRDFSQLIGQQVAVTYEGTLDDFHLGNITAK